MRDFTSKTRNALAFKGIRVLGLTVIPNPNSDMLFATGDRGYRIDDNGCSRVATFSQVLEMAA